MVHSSPTVFHGQIFRLKMEIFFLVEVHYVKNMFCHQEEMASLLVFTDLKIVYSSTRWINFEFSLRRDPKNWSLSSKNFITSEKISSWRILHESMSWGVLAKGKGGAATNIKKRAPRTPCRVKVVIRVIWPSWIGLDESGYSDHDALDYNVKRSEAWQVSVWLLWFLVWRDPTFGRIGN